PRVVRRVAEACGKGAGQPAVQDQLEAVEIRRVVEVREDTVRIGRILEVDADQVIDLPREVDELPAERAVLGTAAEADLEVPALLGFEVRIADLAAVLEVELLGVRQPERRADLPAKV